MVSTNSEDNSQKKLDEKTIRKTFENCDDMTLETIYFHSFMNKVKVLFTYSPGLSDKDQLNNVITPSLESLFKAEDATRMTTNSLKDLWPKASLKILTTEEELIRHGFNGDLILYMESIGATYSIDIAKHPKRSPSESPTEISILGPRDALIEELSDNIALVRKRLPSPTLRVKDYVIGRRTKTKISLLYLDDILNKETLSEIKNMLSTIDIDGLVSSNQLIELITPNVPIIPIFENSSRPDFVVDSLLRGRFIIMMDGLPTAIIGPANLFLLMKSAEDSQYSFLYVSFERVFRVIGLTVAIFVPGFWVALITFHQNQIPMSLLATLIQARKGVPFPTALEAFIMLGLFELFREAGLRLPKPVGQTLAVVGGIIIGDAAVAAGITSPSMVVVIATSLVATFTITNQSLTGVISVLRLGVIILSSLLGLYGLMLAAFVIFLYLSNLRPFGIPYLTPLSPMRGKEFLNSIFRFPWSKVKKRPRFLNTDDSTKS